MSPRNQHLDFELTEESKCTPCQNASADCITSAELKRRRLRKAEHNAANNSPVTPMQPQILRNIASESVASDVSVASMSTPLSTFRPSHQFKSSIDGFPRADPHISSLNPPSTDPEKDEDAGTVIGHMGRLVSDGESAFFTGLSTGVHFMTQAEQRQHMTFPSTAYSLYRHYPMFLPRATESSLDLPTIIAEFPPNGEELIESAINLWLNIYPLWHKSHTIGRYRQIYSNPISAGVEDVYHMLALLALATLPPLGAEVVVANIVRAANAEKLYALSATLLVRVMECPHLTTLQGLATMCIYLQLTGRHNKVMQLSGAINRLAQSLGLHRHSQRFKFKPLETELRRRIWWCIYAQDVFMSTYHGLPRALRDQDIDTDMPAPVSHHQITADYVASPLPGEASEMGSALLFFRLARIMGAALETLYTTTRRRGGVQKIAQLQAELDIWNRDIDFYRQVDTADSVRNEYSLQGMSFLRYTYYIVVLHVHRPALTFEESHPQFHNSLKRSREAAESLLELVISRHVDFSLLFVYPSGLHIIWQAALLLLYEILVTKSGPRQNTIPAVTACIEFLRSFAREDPKVESCTATLESLLQRTTGHGANDSQAISYPNGEIDWHLVDWGSASALDVTNDLDATPFQFTVPGDFLSSTPW